MLEQLNTQAVQEWLSHPVTTLFRTRLQLEAEAYQSLLQIDIVNNTLAEVGAEAIARMNYAKGLVEGFNREPDMMTEWLKEAK